MSAADALALFGRLYERATGVINDSTSELANTVLKEAVCVAEVSGRVLPRASHRRQHPAQRQSPHPQQGTGAFGRWFD
ncbi:MAG TPA: hypothetical protein VNV37_11245 [Solirubrobacteraceae bacterium]|nr:hypothetical protein [Solirubrobacteraceae bacterium]